LRALMMIGVFNRDRKGIEENSLLDLL